MVPTAPASSGGVLMAMCRASGRAFLQVRGQFRLASLLPVVIAALGLAGSLSARGETAPVRVHINQAIQPFSLPETKSGLQADIIRAAFATQGLKTEFAYLPNARAADEYARKNVDVITTAKPDSDLSMTLSRWPVFTFHNQVITLREKRVKLNSIAELGALRILAFQNASKVLGPEFAEMAKTNPRYLESSKMSSMMLHADRVDAIVSQADVFRFNLLTQAGALNLRPDPAAFEYHDILGSENKYWLGFRSKDLRDAFERGIAAIYRSGEIEKLFAHYQKQFQTSRDMFVELDCRFKTEMPPAGCSGSGASAKSGNRLRVTFGISRPPFVIDRDEGGISVDLFREAMARNGLRFQPLFSPNRKMEADLASGVVDVAVEVQKTSANLHYSAPFITYTNVVAVRAGKGQAVTQWSDLKGHSVCAWQMAEANLGPAFAAARAQFSSYEEYGVQRDQVRMFVLGRCSALVIDRNLLIWHLGELAAKKEASTVPKPGELMLFPVPGQAEIDWYVGFRDPSLKTRFDLALRSMRLDGTYQRIVERYLRGGY